MYNALVVPPADLTMHHVMESPAVVSLALKPRPTDPSQLPAGEFVERGGILTTPGIGYALNATGATLIAGTRKWMTWPTTTPPSLTVPAARENLQHIGAEQVHHTPFLPVPHLFSAFSLTGYISKHWLPVEVALEHAAQPELISPSGLPLAVSRRLPQIWLEWSTPRSSQMNSTEGTSKPVLPVRLEDRGRMDGDTQTQLIRAGDLLLLQPVMRTLDGQAWQLTLTVQGPDFSRNYSYMARPRPLGGDLWISGRQSLLLTRLGRYTVEISGRTFWPDQTYTVRYYFIAQPDSH